MYSGPSRGELSVRCHRIHTEGWGTTASVSMYKRNNISRVIPWPGESVDFYDRLVKCFVRFIPGSSASDVYFQAYLLENLARWNQTRTLAAVWHVCV